MTFQKVFTANRIAAAATWITGLAGFIAGITQVLPHTWQNTAVAISGVLAQLLVTLHYLTGSQKFDALTVGPVASVTASSPQAQAEKLRAQLTSHGITPSA